MAVLMLGSLAPIGAHASFCGDAAILSRTGVSGMGAAFDANSVACDQDSADSRLLQPGATEIVLRYAPVPQPPLNGPSVCGDLNGLAGVFNHLKVELKPTQVVSGIVAYQSDWLSIPLGVSGSITGTVYPLSSCPGLGGTAETTPLVALASTTYHTAA